MMAKQTKKQKKQVQNATKVILSSASRKDAGELVYELIAALYDKADHLRGEDNPQLSYLESEVGEDDRHPVVDRSHDRASALDALAHMLEELSATSDGLETLDRRWLLYRLMRATKWVADPLYADERPHIKHPECAVQVTGPDGRSIEFQVGRAHVSSCFN